MKAKAWLCLDLVWTWRASVASVGLAMIAAVVGCGGGTTQVSDPQELVQLRNDNEQLQKLRRENMELAKLRGDNQEMLRLRKEASELDRLRQENEQLRAQLTRPASARPAAIPSPAPEPAAKRQPIKNLPQAFEQAAASLPQDNIREEDIPKEGDRILIGQNVIGLLIPEFDKNTNGGPYEISGWLKGFGVSVKNYQQFHVLGITNFQVLRAPAESPNPPKN